MKCKYCESEIENLSSSVVISHSASEHELVDQFYCSRWHAIRGMAYQEGIALGDKLENPETFGVNDLKKFILQHEGVTDEQARGFASRVVSRLLDQVADCGRLVAFCSECGKQRGECPHNRYEVRGRLWYYDQPRNWRFSRDSFLRLTDEDLRGLYPATAQRIRDFANHLRSN